MKRFLIVVAAAVLAACGTTKTAGPPRYRAWCNSETKYLGPWRDTREEAEADREAHLKNWGWHAVRIDTAD